MTDDKQTAHEALADERAEEAHRLEQEGDRLEGDIDKAKATAKRAAEDPFVAAPAEEEPDEGGPEQDYPAKR